ncbi:MAG TPA: hypothetical protein VHE83_02980 [Mycobacteriales bacterium]|nr:hypothetical protein [Mycobacteriales bacterium]
MPSDTTERTLPAASPDSSTWSSSGTRRRYRLTAIVALGGTALALGLAACGEDDDKDKESNPQPVATASCATPPPIDTASVLPADFPLPSGGTPYKHETQGATKIEYIHVTGTADQLTDIRDAELNSLIAAGYKKDDTDQEKGKEADGEFSGPHKGSINVRQASDCAGLVTVRITLES